MTRINLKLCSLDVNTSNATCTDRIKVSDLPLCKSDTEFCGYVVNGKIQLDEATLKKAGCYSDVTSKKVG